MAIPSTGGLDPPAEGPEHAAFWDNYNAQRQAPATKAAPKGAATFTTGKARSLNLRGNRSRRSKRASPRRKKRGR